MGLQFILGKESADKKQAIYGRISRIMTEEPDADIFVLVPEHAKFEAEMSILDNLWDLGDFKGQDMIGSMNLQTFSFSRLAWYLLKKSPIFQRQQLTEAGLSMLVRKILLEKEQDLILFRREANKEGFIQQLTDLFLELRSGRIEEGDLLEMLSKQEDSSNGTDFQLKLEELTTLYHAFNEALLDKYLEKEVILEALAGVIESLDMQHTYIFIDGFYRFTARELQIVTTLLRSAKQVTITLALDKAYVSEAPAMHQLFYTAGSTYHMLYHLARGMGVPVMKDHWIAKDTDGYCDGILRLEEYWIASSEVNGNKLQDSFALTEEQRASIQIWGCETKQAEVFHVANHIKKLVAEENYRYKDILILARTVEEYETIVKPIFDQTGMDVFYDKADAMKHHPFMDFIDALFRIRRHHWRYPDIMRLLRTELVTPVTHEKAEDLQATLAAVLQFREKVDVTENVMLAYGFEGNRWITKEDWYFARFKDEDGNDQQSPEDKLIWENANDVRNFLKDLLLPFHQKMAKAKTGREAATLLYNFLVAAKVDRQMIFWRDLSLEQEKLTEARQQEQIWKVFLNLLDEYVELLGDSPFNAAAFHEILMTGFQNATFSLVPPSIDQVVFSSIEGARFEPSKVVFLMGMTQDHLPAQKESKSLLTQEDREKISGSLNDNSNNSNNEEKYLHPTTAESMAAEPYVAYQAFLSGTDKLIFSYPMSSEDSKKSPKLSPYVARIAAALDIPVVVKPQDIADAEDTTAFLGTKEQNISQLVHLLRQQRTTKEPIPTLWKYILAYISKVPDANRIMRQVFTSLWHKNVPSKLTAPVAEKLYGKELYLSVSQLERYFEDPYSHFLQYGLKLKERAKYELSPAGTGEFFHEALELIVNQLKSRLIDTDNLSEETVQHIADAVLQDLYGKEKYTILSTSNRMGFIREQLGETIQKMAWVINQHGRRTALRNIRTEAVFGQMRDAAMLDGLHMPLNNGGTLHIRGKIDRIDLVNSGSENYLTILDYKSSAHSFNFSDAYYGLAMQMITYLDVALLNADKLLAGKTLPAGAFYLHIKNPFIKQNNFLTLEEYQQTIISDYKLKGLLLNDPAVLDTIDPAVESGQSSQVFPFNKLKGGNLGKKNELISLDDFQRLINKNRANMVEAGEKILSGDLKLDPIKDRPYTPSVSGPYRAISQFDNTLPENRYRKYVKLSKEDVLAKIKEEMQDGQEDINQEGDEA
ncbi:DNA helicase/exodeoxyribonuclease V subunit B [Trichococcus patagoniensis]|uniref:DNA helicase/exodeoxyribonuclease V subunit B n=1 Tax=Trichococcus patagoniensis TaxID=382641 RepID=A0A2T5IL00_9LACT|nr:PD-(D/E)XK nuclease family protein [Trichococcus patagoniensis]PTQ84506.1 DNA helicase/exodeoxyribonuclease V subunit B [Trichococcus patagoniensis]